MPHKIINKIIWLLHEIRSRKIAFATPFVIYAFFVVDWIWLLSGFMFYWVAKSIFIATYHEYQVHKWIRPKYKFIELLGISSNLMKLRLLHEAKSFLVSMDFMKSWNFIIFMKQIRIL